jgi:lambda family phage portal protein
MAGLLTSLIARVAPEAALRRLRAEAAFSALDKRDYYGAGRGKGTDNWRAGATSADAEIAKGGPVLRARMRDLVRNSPIAASAVQVLVSNIIGTGIRPRAATESPELNRAVDALWARFCAECDFHGLTDFYGLQALALREMVEGGEVLAIQHVMRRSGARTVPLQVELKEADHFDDTRSETGDGRRIEQGIEFDGSGRRVAYWLFPDHPGAVSTRARTSESERVPASQVSHLFERQRMQNRGVPWGAPVIRALRDLDDWQVAELVRKKTEACLVGVVLGGEPDRDTTGTLVTRSDGTQVEKFEPGMFFYANGATDLKMHQPVAAGGVYEWNRVQLHLIASGFRVPYALLTGDLSQTNFSSSRVGLNDFRRMVEMLQWGTVIPMLCQPVWDWFVRASQLAGQLPEGPVPCEWAPPRFESVNPLQDAQADLLEVRAGFSTTPAQIARRGYDPDAVMQEQAAFNEKADGLGLIFDSDPRKVAKSGAVQAEPGEPAAKGSEPE